MGKAYGPFHSELSSNDISAIAIAFELFLVMGSEYAEPDKVLAMGESALNKLDRRAAGLTQAEAVAITLALNNAKRYLAGEFPQWKSAVGEDLQASLSKHFFTINRLEAAFSSLSE